jgi:hypothetical protein
MVGGSRRPAAGDAIRLFDEDDAEPRSPRRPRDGDEIARADASSGTVAEDETSGRTCSQIEMRPRRAGGCLDLEAVHTDAVHETRLPRTGVRTSPGRGSVRHQERAHDRAADHERVMTVSIEEPPTAARARARQVSTAVPPSQPSHPHTRVRAAAWVRYLQDRWRKVKIRAARSSGGSRPGDRRACRGRGRRPPGSPSGRGARRSPRGVRTGRRVSH